jgi:hypothetical protein
MSLVLATRILLYVQFVLGILQSPGLYNGVPALLHTHRAVAFVVPIVAFLAFRPSATLPRSTAKTVARYGPGVSLVLGLVNWIGFKTFAIIPAEAYFVVIAIHMLVGMAVVACVEIASGKARRAMVEAQIDAVTSK